ncbi:anthrone oxygenase family protein [Myxosarcina sp. GI1]|uniref:anthrone oxygenase family protein n=1 Tax=Myxosarcina sp. GI1 TaxID=1541065 RepID=UPI0005669488|nr:DUF1772 domain-containing protein [Myxosarcina sp. GI1]
MKTSENIVNHRKRKTKFLLKPAQFIALLLMGIELGVSYSHLMQLPGKLRLSATTFIAVQTVLIQYKIGVGIAEVGSFLAMLIILWLVRTKILTFRLTLGALLMLIAAFLVWGIFIEPINAVVDTWTADSFPNDWTSYRDRWHLFHLVRLVLLTIGMSSLVSSVLVKEG